MIKNFFLDEEGMGTVEMVLIIAALVAIAILFKDAITKFVEENLKKVFSTAEDSLKESESN